MQNSEQNTKFSIDKDGYNYRDIQLSVTGDNDWYFRGDEVVTKSQNVGGDDGYEWVTNRIGAVYNRKRKDAVVIPGIETTLYLYLTEGGSYIAYRRVTGGVYEAKIIETIMDIKSFFGENGLAKQVYQELVKSNPHLASGLLGDYLNVIK